MSDLLKGLKEITGSSENIYLDKENLAKVQELCDLNVNELATTELEKEKELLSLAMSNFGLFYYFATNLSRFSIDLKHAIISKVMYASGSCGTPAEISESYHELLSSCPSSYWDLDETFTSVDSLRDEILQDSEIGIEPLIDEFENTGSTSMVTTIMRNPVFPRELIQEVANRSHAIFDGFDEGDGDYLVERALDILNGDD
jgi:hypothetical protein